MLNNMFINGILFRKKCFVFENIKTPFVFVSGSKQSCNMVGLNRGIGKLNLNSSAQQKATYSQPMRGTVGLF